MFKRYKTAACSRSSLSICYAILLVLSVLCFPKTNPNIQRFRTLLSFCLGINYNEFYEWRLSQLYTQLLQLRKESLKNIQACTGFEPLTSAIPVQRFTNEANKPTGSSPLNWFVINPWKDDDELMNTKIMYVNCWVKNYMNEDHRSYIRNFGNHPFYGFIGFLVLELFKLINFFYTLLCSTGSSHKSLQRALVTLMVSQPKRTYVLSV